MGYYATGTAAYWVDENGDAYDVSLTAVDKVQEVRELESVTVVVGNKTKLPWEAVSATLDNLVKKFHVSEDNPLPMASKPKAPKKGEEK